MASFARANELYKQGKYQEALNEYICLQGIYGGQILSVNIQQCRKKIGEAQNIDTKPSKTVGNNASQESSTYNPSNTSKYRRIFSEKYEGSSRSDVVSLVELAELDLIDNRLKDCLHKIKVAISLNKDYRKIYEIGEKAAQKAGDLMLSQDYQSKKISCPQKRV